MQFVQAARNIHHILNIHAHTHSLYYTSGDMATMCEPFETLAACLSVYAFFNVMLLTNQKSLNTPTTKTERSRCRIGWNIKHARTKKTINVWKWSQMCVCWFRSSFSCVSNDTYACHCQLLFSAQRLIPQCIRKQYLHIRILAKC